MIITPLLPTNTKRNDLSEEGTKYRQGFRFKVENDEGKRLGYFFNRDEAALYTSTKRI